MQINSNTYQPNFKAIRIAHTQNFVKGMTTNIDILRITRDDEVFLENLKQISIKKLCPKLREDLQERWQKVLDYCVKISKLTCNKSYVAITDNRPCCIMSTCKYQDSNKLFLDGICAIPNADGKKTNLGGQTLLYQLFLDAISDKTKGVELEAIHNGPVDVVKKYQELGFTTNNSSEDYTNMTCNKFKVEEQLKKFASQIDYTPVEEEYIKLEDIIN